MSHMPHFGVTLPQIKRSWTEASEAAIDFDQLGFDSVWVCDHVYGVPNPALPIFEAWSQLAAVAAITEKVQLGTLVTPPLFRNAGVLAKQVATIDHISNGRTIMGLGAGWFPPEFESYGIPFPSLGKRMQALDETVQALKALWTEERVSFDGEYCQLRDAVCEPKPIRRPPILVGGSGEKVLMGIAARHADIWNNMAVTQGQLAQKVEAMRKRCDEVGRDFSTLRISQQCTVIIEETEDAARQALTKAQKIFGGHMGSGLEAHGIWGSPAQVVDGIERHRSLGVTDFVIEFFGRNTRPAAQRFAETVIPCFS